MDRAHAGGDLTLIVTYRICIRAGIRNSANNHPFVGFCAECTRLIRRVDRYGAFISKAGYRSSARNADDAPDLENVAILDSAARRLTDIKVGTGSLNLRKAPGRKQGQKG